jgi:hypothetical protein
LRLEKFKSDQIVQFQKELSEKNSEIEVLKEMVKASQLSIKAREKEIVR